MTFSLTKYIPEKYLHEAFDIGVILKGVDGVLEILGSVLLFVITPTQINTIVNFLTRYELAEDPRDPLANYLIHISHIVPGMELFGALYLASHGIIKLIIVIGLFKEKYWAYPFGIIVFSGFIAYQLYKFFAAGSLWMLILSILDAVVVWLTWHEYQYVRRKIAQEVETIVKEI